MNVLVLVDCQNLYYSCRAYDQKLDFINLQKMIMAYYPEAALKMMAYVVADKCSDTKSFERLLNSLGFGYRIKRATKNYREEHGRLQRVPTNDTNHDTNMIIDALDSLNWSDQLLLISGDGDFLDLLEKFGSRGKYIEVWSFRSAFSRQLLKVADSVKFLDNETGIRRGRENSEGYKESFTEQDK